MVQVILRGSVGALDYISTARCVQMRSIFTVQKCFKYDLFKEKYSSQDQALTYQRNFGSKVSQDSSRNLPPKIFLIKARVFSTSLAQAFQCV